MPYSPIASNRPAMNRIPTDSTSSLMSEISRKRSLSGSQYQRPAPPAKNTPESPSASSTKNASSTNINGSKNISKPSNDNALFVGINLPADKPGIAHPYTDRALVDSAISNDYDMITSRISSPAYRKRIESLYAQAEEAWGTAVAASQGQALNRHGSINKQTPYRHNRVASSAHSVASRASSGASQYHMRYFSGASASPGSMHNRPRTHVSQTPSLRSFDSISVPPLGLDDILLLPGPHLHNVIALAAPWAELDSKNPSIAALSIQVIVQEVAYASYCGVAHIVLPGPKRRTNVEQYASAVSRIIAQASPRAQLIVNLPFAEDDYVSSRTGIHIPPADHLSIWDVWNTIRTITNYPPNLSVALQIPPKCSGFPVAVANRWYAEPVKMLTLSASIFMPNAKRYPVLPKATQNLLFRFFQKSPFIMLADVYEPRDFAGGSQSYLLYIRHLLRVRPKPSLVDSYAPGYADLLQLPLQPLADNLENSTYEVFERDATKYNIYEKAIAAALLDIPKAHIQVAVAGAGRGPLVEKALNAAATVGKTVHIYAIEKNASACIHLARRKEFEWTPENLASALSSNADSSQNSTLSSVSIVHADLRSWRPPASASRVHLIVSELLGSFGDNELSPECLDALDTPEVLDPECGVIIPQEYAAWFTPVMSSELYKRAANFKLPNAASSVFAGSPSNAASNSSVGALNSTSRANTGMPFHPLNTPSVFHTPYVVHLDAVDYVAPEQYAKAWEFRHSSPMGACLASAEILSEAASNAENVNRINSPMAGYGNSKNYHNAYNTHTNGTRVSSNSGAAAFRANSLSESGGAGGGAGFGLSSIASNGSDSTASFHSPTGAVRGGSVHSPIIGGRCDRGANSINRQMSSSIAEEVAEASRIAAETTAAVKTLCPIVAKNLANTRKAKHTFMIPRQCVVHGIAGFFECRLYGNIGFSTRPDINSENNNMNAASSTTSVNGGRSVSSFSYVPDSDEYSESDNASRKTDSGRNGSLAQDNNTTAFGIPHTKEMLSWFPIWFPFSKPKYISEQSEIDISMWRRTDGSRVWYEWAMESFLSAGRLAPRKLSPDLLEELTKSSIALQHHNSSSTASYVGSLDYDIDMMSEEGHLRKAQQVASKYAEPQSKRRIRTGSTELHNPGGVHFSMTL